MRNKPIKLNWLTAIKKRGNLTNSERQEYHRLQSGYEGEKKFDQLFIQNAPKIHTYWDDVELEYCGRKTQMDKIILQEDKLELLDFKNYQGNYQYKEGRLYLNGKILPYNLFNQMDRCQQVYERLLDDYGLPLTVQAKIIFVNPAGKFEYLTPPKIEVIQYPQIPWWLTELNENYRLSPLYKDCQRILSDHRGTRFRDGSICSDERYAGLKKGFHCAKCGSFDVWFDRYTMSCVCGFIEAKEIAYARTVCEYGVIMHHKPLTRKALLDFLGNKGNESYLKKILRQHFELEIKNNKGSCYHNKGVPFEEWFVDKKEYFKIVGQRITWRN